MNAIITFFVPHSDGKITITTLVYQSVFQILIILLILKKDTIKFAMNTVKPIDFAPENDE